MNAELISLSQATELFKAHEACIQLQARIATSMAHTQFTP